LSHYASSMKLKYCLQLLLLSAQTTKPPSLEKIIPTFSLVLSEEGRSKRWRKRKINRKRRSWM
jgi:hypothetical protein